MVYGNLVREQFEALNFSTESKVSLMEAYINALESYNSDDEDVFTEGSNADILNTFRAGKNKYKVALRAVKKAIKEGDAKTAKAKIKEARGIIDDCKKDIRKIPDDLTSAMIGTIINLFITFAYLIFPTLSIQVGRKKGFWAGLGTFILEVPASKLFPTWTMTIRGIVRTIKLCDEINSEAKKGVVDKRLYNQFRLHCVSLLTECDDVLNELEKKIK